METELKPCPFCGSKEIGLIHGGRSYWAHCNDCHAEGPMNMPQSEIRAIKLWNAAPRSETR